MGLYKKFIGNTRKPNGVMGRLMVTGMNSGHAALADWGSQFLGEKTSEAVLDMGCGGGANVKRFLKKYSDAHVIGADYSDVSVEKACGLNADAIRVGRCEIVRKDVSRLDFPECSFDLATAFETVYFWPEIARCFENILRVLQPDGRFLIVNESNGTDAFSVKFARSIEGMNLYTPERLKELLEKVGFMQIELHKATNKPWIAVLAYKT